MKDEKVNNTKVTKTDLVFILGMAVFAFLTWIGLKIEWYDNIVCTFITILYVGLIVLFVFGLKKIKTVETKFKTWKIVEISLLSLFVLLLLLFINTPMSRTLYAFGKRNDLEKQASKELSNIEKALDKYEEQEKDAINKTINTLRNIKGYSTSKGCHFDDCSKRYIDFYVNKGHKGGYITEDKISDYEKLLTEIFIKDHKDYLNKVRDTTDKMKREWGIFNLYELLDYSEKIDELYKEVEKELTKFSKTHHSEIGYPYKFMIKKDYSQNIFVVDSIERLEFEYDIPNDISYNLDDILYDLDPKQSVFLRKVKIITDTDHFGLLCIVINIMILFPYLMANRSTKVEIKKMYDKKQKKDLGCEVL